MEQALEIAKFWFQNEHVTATVIQQKVAKVICKNKEYIDMHRTICIYRAFKRIVKYRNKTRPDMGAGCEERFDLQFFKWIWEYPNTKRPTILKGLEQLSEEKKVIVLKSPNEVRKFLEHI